MRKGSAGEGKDSPSPARKLLGYPCGCSHVPVAGLHCVPGAPNVHPTGHGWPTATSVQVVSPEGSGQTQHCIATQNPTAGSQMEPGGPGAPPLAMHCDRGIPSAHGGTSGSLQHTNGSTHLQSAVQGLPSAHGLVSHCSPGSTIPSPHAGSGHVQSVVQTRSPGHVAESGGSHCSVDWITPSPQRASQGKIELPVSFRKFLRSCSHEGRGWTSQSCASQYALHRPKAAPGSPLQTVSCDGGLPSGVLALAPCGAVPSASAASNATPRCATLRVERIIGVIFSSLQIGMMNKVLPPNLAPARVQPHTAALWRRAKPSRRDSCCRRSFSDASARSVNRHGREQWAAMTDYDRR